MIKKSAYVGAFLLFLFSVISCEKDFTDIGTSVINNGVFETKDTVLNISITQEDIASVRADGGIGIASLGEYLLGVYKSDDYRKIEASIVSQIGFLSGLKVVDKTYGTDTTVVTTMDKVLIRMPYQATETGSTLGVREYQIDTIGNSSIPVLVKVYENLTFLNTLDPTNPTQQNMYQSDATYSFDPINGLLNEDPNFEFTVPQSRGSGMDVTLDTVYYFNRHLSTGATIPDTIKIANSAPFFTIPLNKDKIKTLFLDQYESANFETAAEFNNYFRGIIIEASGNDGSIIPFNFSSSVPTLDIFYTNTVLKNGVVIDTITKTNSFPLTGVRNSIYKPSLGSTQTAENFAVQGTAGTMANIGVFQGTQLQELRSQNWLINDASLIFYVEKNKDTTYTPGQLFLFKNGANNPSQIKDIITEGTSTFGGQLIREDGAVDRYHFRITDYVSDLLSGESSYNPPLGLRVFNLTDIPTTFSDTIVRSFNWNPRGIVLHSNTSANSERKAQLKISYSIKINN